MSVANPDWYVQKKINAGLDVDLSNPRKDIASLVVTKIVIIAALLAAAWHIAGKAGYL